MFRASSIIKNARLDKELEYAEISKKLKINAKYLEAIENEATQSFPQEPYCSLIVKDYADFLGLNGEQILRLFHRDFAQKKKAKQSGIQNIGITPQFTFKVSVLLTVAVFIGYLALEYVKFNRPPKLKVNWPIPEAVVNDSVEISGITDPESTIRVNDDLVIVDPSGKFTKKIIINENNPIVVVESKSVNGKTTKEEKSIR